MKKYYFSFMYDGQEIDTYQVTDKNKVEARKWAQQYKTLELPTKFPKIPRNRISIH